MSPSECGRTARERLARASEDPVGASTVAVIVLAFGIRVSFVPILSLLSMLVAVAVLAAPCRETVRQWRRGERRRAAGQLAVLSVPVLFVLTLVLAYG